MGEHERAWGRDENRAIGSKRRRRGSDAGAVHESVADESRARVSTRADRSDALAATGDSDASVHLGWPVSFALDATVSASLTHAHGIAACRAAVSSRWTITTSAPPPQGPRGKVSLRHRI